MAPLKRKRYECGADGNQKEEQRARVKCEVLKLSVNALSVTKLERIMNPIKADLLIARAFNLSQQEILSILRGAAGGGVPHERFLDLVYYNKGNEPISVLINCFKELPCEDNIPLNIIQGIIKQRESEQKELKVISDLTPSELHKFSDVFAEDPRNGLKPCWRDVADGMEMQETVEVIENSIVQDYCYSGTRKLISILNTKVKTIGDIYEKLIELDIPNILNEVKRQIEEKVERKLKRIT